jgi:hypothetical protein
MGSRREQSHAVTGGCENICATRYRITQSPPCSGMQPRLMPSAMRALCETDSDASYTTVAGRSRPSALSLCKSRSGTYASRIDDRGYSYAGK